MDFYRSGKRHILDPRFLRGPLPTFSACWLVKTQQVLGLLYSYVHAGSQLTVNSQFPCSPLDNTITSFFSPTQLMTFTKSETIWYPWNLWNWHLETKEVGTNMTAWLTRSHFLTNQVKIHQPWSRQPTENFSLKTSACQWPKELEFMLLSKILRNISSPYLIILHYYFLKIIEIK